jgi:small subunit ribosomal protein S4
MCPSRKAARIAIAHNHFTVNGKPVNKPGYLVNVLDRIEVRNREASRKMARACVDADPNRPVQPWLKLDAASLTASVVALPSRDDVQIPVEEQLIVEFCSR